VSGIETDAILIVPGNEKRTLRGRFKMTASNGGTQGGYRGVLWFTHRRVVPSQYSSKWPRPKLRQVRQVRFKHHHLFVPFQNQFRGLRSTVSSAVGIMAGPLGLGFTPSELDAYLGIQVACEKIAKTHGFQSDAVFRVYQEVKDLRKAEEIVIGMKRAAEKDAIERIMKVREKTKGRG
jgi:hypothetical protein